MYTLDFHREAQKEYDRLDGSQKIIVDKSFKRIKDIGMMAGEGLSGKLHHCRKMKHKQAGLRIIFKESEFGIEIIEIIAVRDRVNKKVYRDAENRI